MILIKLHCVRKYELDVMRELSDIRVLLPFKVFLRSVFVKSIDIHLGMRRT
jgi:hypothetical protein